ncbi:MAG: hypothetical protein RMA76_03805 [Deltaproteobacteria bacterium]
MRGARLSWLLAASACTASPSKSATAPAPPDEVTYLLAVARGEGVTASALVRRVDDDVGAELPESWTDADEAWILGFTDDELERIPLVPSAEPARAAGDRDALLAAPAWQVHGVIEAGAATLAVDGVPPPELTVAGLPACPQVYGPDSYADVRCRVDRCVAPIQQEGCDIAIDEFSCEIGFDVRLDGRGNPVDNGSCETGPDHEGARSVVQCDDPPATRCPIHLYDGLEPIAGRVETATVYAVEARPVNDEPYEDTGFLSGLAVLEDRVVVAGHGGAAEPLICPAMANELTFFDRSDLSRIKTTTVGRCLRELVAAEDRATFYMIYGTHPFVQFAEVDADGEILREVARVTNGGREYGRIVLTGGDAVFLERSVAAGVDTVVAVDLESFTVTATDFSDAPPRRLSDVYPFQPGQILIAERDRGVVVRFDVGTGAIVDETPLCEGAKHPEAIFSDGRFAFALGNGDRSSLSVIDLSSISAPCVLAKYFAGFADTRVPVGIVGDRLWVAARRFEREEDVGRAVLAAYDPSRESFLAGALDLGPGLPTHAVLVDDVIYVVLAWSGHLVRVRDL